MHCKFPYFEDRPHIPIILEYNGNRVRFLPLLDSGADDCIFYRKDAQRLGLNWEEGKDIEMNSADGENFLVRQFLLTMEIEGEKIKVKISFAHKPYASMPLLGRRDVFKHFQIIISEREKWVELKSV